MICEICKNEIKPPAVYREKDKTCYCHKCYLKILNEEGKERR